jgi:uncharacterized membrane protein YjjP (DUF1212 family)
VPAGRRRGPTHDEGRVGARGDVESAGYHRGVTAPAPEIVAVPADGAGRAADDAHPDVQRVLRLAMRVGVLTLASGSQTNDVEDSMDMVARAYGVTGVQAAVTFSTISISHYATTAEPATTLLHLVKDRTTDFTRLASVSDVTKRIRRGELDLAAAETELDRMETVRPVYGRAVAFAAPGLSAAGSTLMFGGNLLESVATLGIGLLIQPVLYRIDKSALPPFFQLAIGSGMSAILVAALVGVGLPISEGLVLTGSLLRFLPGYALVSGFRDLIDGSMISGTSRLVEAVLLAGAVAGGVGLSLAIATSFGIQLGIVTVGQTAWGVAVSVIASLLAVGAYAVRLGSPPRAVWQAALVGAVAWLPFRALANPFGPIDPAVATFGATILVGMLGRVLVRRLGGVSSLWVVPAILPFLPGLQLVQALLAETERARVDGLVAAAGMAFLIGTGVATGDILIALARGLRDQVVAPAVGAVAGGVDVLVIAPVGRAVDRVRHVDPGDDNADEERRTAADHRTRRR